MPFTPTHILAVLPIYCINRQLVFIALAVGAMIPDFPMFFPISSYYFSHSIIGIVLYCVPMGLIFYYLFERMGKQFLIDISPLWVQQRMCVYRATKPGLDIKKLAILSFAIVIGSATHIVWDAFTHSWGWGVKLFPSLQQTIGFWGFTLPLFKTFQYMSTLIGLPILAWFSILYLRRIQPKELTENDVVSTSLKLTAIFMVLLIPGVIALYHWQQGAGLTSIIGHTIKETIGAVITVFFLMAAIHHWCRKKL